LPEVMTALAQRDAQGEIDDAARTQEKRRPLRRDARAVGRQEKIGREELAIGGADLPQTGRSHLLAGLDEKLGVEAELAAAPQHGAERAQIDAVLALVVGGAAAIEIVAALGELPRREAVAPLPVEPTDDVAMAIAEYRERVAVFAALGKEERSGAGGVGEAPAAKAQRFQARPQLVLEICHERGGAAVILALGRDGDAPREIADETAVIEIGERLGDRGVAVHDLLRRRVAATPDGYNTVPARASRQGVVAGCPAVCGLQEGGSLAGKLSCEARSISSRMECSPRLPMPCVFSPRVLMPSAL